MNFEPSEIDQWLTDAGWFPTRDIGSTADELIQVRIEDASRQGTQLVAHDAATRFIHSYGELELPLHGKSPDAVLMFDPTVGYDGDAEDFIELATGLNRQLFPVGAETYEYGIWLIDDTGRFFYLHHTGGYYLGETPHEAFASILSGTVLTDAEAYFA
ncbi:SUKH-3 domain-containing protein [Nocardia sp. NBC_01327]|uniref:SUKH-3 domain-containing protein n=1 Tax=Nocardia sp. NBC_01327 TaxID=2903593 RepID=UPI002E0D4893|nr:SUKH-3 domain-containing protein [Nocardia sp. NBC_01327]